MRKIKLQFTQCLPTVYKKYLSNKMIWISIIDTQAVIEFEMLN